MLITHKQTLDILVSYCGIVPDGPPGAFMRTRYRVRPKTNLPGPFDAAFWLVHYTHAEAQYQNMVRAGGYQLRPDMIQTLHERRALQSQGLPQRKDFMLVDRGSWPQVIFPAQMPRGGPPTYSGRPGPGQANQPPFAYAGPNAHAAGPPAKRARQSGPAQAGAVPPPPVSLFHDAELELLEDTSSGDYLDNISPATISRDRYKRHHLWLEEVFSSLYSPAQIAAEDLGFGLVGELGELTKGILNPPKRKDLQEQERKDPVAFYQDPQINESSVYKHLDTDQFAEFEKRVAAFVDGRNKEMDEMREKHAKVMSRVNKGKFYMDAEERLKEAGTDSEKIESIVREVELKMGISLSEHHDVICVQRGALEEEEKSVTPVPEVPLETNGNPLAANGASTSLSGENPGHITTAAQPAASTTSATAPAGLASNDGMDLDAPVSSSQNPVPVAAPAPTPQPQMNTAVTSPPSAPIPAHQPLPATNAPTANVPATEQLKGPTPPNEAPLITDDLSNEVGDLTGMQGHDELLQNEPESMFDEADFTSFNGMDNDFTATGDDGLLDLEAEFDVTGGNAQYGQS